MQKLSLSKLDQFLEAMAAHQALYLPVEDHSGQCAARRTSSSPKLRTW